MKTIYMILTVFAISNVSLAGTNEKVADCSIYKLYDDRVFTGSLSVTEHPDLWIDSSGPNNFRVTIGSAGFDTNSGDNISYSTGEDSYQGVVAKAEVRIISEDETIYLLKHTLTDEENSATLFVNFKGEATFSKVAKFVCREFLEQKWLPKK